MATAEPIDVSIGLSSVTGTGIKINGTGSNTGNFSFFPSSGAQFAIDDVYGNPVLPPVMAALTGKTGRFDAEGGAFQVSGYSKVGPVESAVVPTNGTLTIFGGPGGDLTAKLTWVDLNVVGSYGLANLNGQLNVSDFAYAGSDPALQMLAKLQNVYMTLSFSTQRQSLAKLLENGHSYSTTFESRMTGQVPEPSTLAGLFGMGLVGLACLWRRRK